MLSRTALALIAALMPFGTALAQDSGPTGPVVVELFTSQGCASCPPADALLGELASREEVIALALHVDYWDYIGWEDTFAAPEFTQRQYDYGHVAGSNVVYTPQMIVGGQDHVVGYRPMDVADLIQAHSAAPDPVEITVRADGEGFAVDARLVAGPPRPAMIVQLVSYIPHEQVHITRGERAGSVADFYNIVTSWQVVAEWDGSAPFEVTVTPPDDRPQVVIVQEAGPGPILAAARLE